MARHTIMLLEELLPVPGLVARSRNIARLGAGRIDIGGVKYERHKERGKDSAIINC